MVPLLYENEAAERSPACCQDFTERSALGFKRATAKFQPWQRKEVRKQAGQSRGVARISAFPGLKADLSGDLFYCKNANWGARRANIHL